LRVSAVIWKNHGSVYVEKDKHSPKLGGQITKSYYISYQGRKTVQEDNGVYEAYRYCNLTAFSGKAKYPGGTVVEHRNGPTQFNINTLPDVDLALLWYKFNKLDPNQLFAGKGRFGITQVAKSFTLVANFLKAAGAYLLGGDQDVKYCWGPDSLGRFCERLILRRPSTFHPMAVAPPDWLDKGEIRELKDLKRQLKFSGYFIERANVGKVAFMDSQEDDEDDGGGAVYYVP
jgi:hypothetical protein